MLNIGIRLSVAKEQERLFGFLLNTTRSHLFNVFDRLLQTDSREPALRTVVDRSTIWQVILLSAA